jgi:hypothetical protein
MIDGLAREVCKRMEAIGVKGGRKLTLKIMQRRADAAKEPAKFLGHGKCNNLSRSCDITGDCDDWKSISAAAFSLFEGLGIDKDNVRGVGIVLSKLLFLDEDQESSGVTKMTSWLQSGSKKSTCNDISGKDETSSTSKGRKDRGDKGDTSLAEPPPGRAKSFDDRGGDKSSNDSLLPRQMTKYIAKPPSEVLPTEYENESPQSIRDDDAAGGYALPSLSQIDEDILAQMPEDVQASVRRSQFRNERAPADASGDYQMSGQSLDEREKQPSLVGRDKEMSIPLARPAEEDEGGWVLPPLSQIDEDEVMALPTPLREEILKQMHSKEARTTTSFPSVSAKSPKRKKSTFSAHQPISGDSNPNMRQLSLKRMMKLASVRSGQDGNSISLSQLDDLPLELQLQIANNDEGPLRNRRRRMTSNNNIEVGARGSPHQKTNGSPHRAASGMATSVKSPVASRHLSDEDELGTKPNRIEVLDLDDGDSEGDFYHTNILPLMNWINARPDPKSINNDVDHVKDFFFTLLEEKRLDDVTSLMRTIKRRGDNWGGNVYGYLLDVIDDQLIATEGRKLDRSNL